MTQPKFPWVLLVILAMFVTIAVHPATPGYFVVFAVIAILMTSAAAIYQIIPRKDDSLEETEDEADDPWSDKDQP